MNALFEGFWRHPRRTHLNIRCGDSLSVKTGALNLVFTFQNPATFKALLCLAGDFKQLGPVIHSPVAIEYGLQMPLMERIVGKITVDHSRVFTLLDTYRSHPSILKLYNKLIYADVLKCCCPASSYNMESWPACPVDSAGTKHPVIFHHCNGQESRQKDSPSWQNIDEIKIVKDYLDKLKTLGIPADEIGIISPYHKQCQALRIMCKGLQFHVEVGTTELFQGREKRVILMSTVRSRQERWSDMDWCCVCVFAWKGESSLVEKWVLGIYVLAINLCSSQDC